MSVVLMYHALHEGDPHATIDEEDQPYAVAVDDFKAQLDRVVARDEAAAGEGQAPVCITFDDGHVSNHRLALPLLRERGLSATFFITTGFTGQREHFCTREQLADLHAGGMTLGGHGHTHAFFDDLDGAAAHSELEQCQHLLSEVCDGPVSTMSFPGGRHDAAAERLARQSGFTTLFGSTLALAPESSARFDTLVVPRVAIRAGTGLATFDRMIQPDRRWYRTQARRQSAKHLVRSMIGNRIYHGLYRTLSR